MANAGYGSNLSWEGTCELDASVMLQGGEFGAVAAVKGSKEHSSPGVLEALVVCTGHASCSKCVKIAYNYVHKLLRRTGATETYGNKQKLLLGLHC